MPRKEKINAKTWERDRRNRMNTYFKTLADLLPPHQEGRKRNKVDILIHASKYIKELNNRTDELFGAHAGEAHKEELNRLKKLVTQLFSRTQLLSALLRDAGITVPAEPALEKISPLKWSNKINVEDGEKYLDRLTERKKPEKRKTKQIGYKVPSKQKTSGLSNDTAKKNSDENETLECAHIEDQENHVNSSINEGSEIRNDESTDNENGNSIPSRSIPAPPHDGTPTESTVSKPCKRIRKLESRKRVKRKGKLIDLKLKKKKLNATSSQSQSIANLPPGTLIWSAGKLMPLVTPITPLTSNILVSAQAQSANPIILGNAQQNQMIVMQSLTNRVQNSVLPLRNENLLKNVQKLALNTLPRVQTSVGINSRDWSSSVKNIIEATKIGGRKCILPKGKEITTTTMTYKVPIPAIHREPPTTKITESVDVDTKTLKKAKSKKVQRRDKVDEVKETCDKNETTSKTIPEETIKSSEDSEVTEIAEINEKKRKADEDLSAVDQQPKIMKIVPLPEISKSIESLRSVVDKIGESTSETCEKLKKQEDENNSTECEKSNKSTVAENLIVEPVEPEIKDIPEPEHDSSTKLTPEQSENSVNNSDPSKDPIESKVSTKWSSKSENNTSNSALPENDVPAFEPAKTFAEPERSAGPTALSEVDEAIAEAGVVSDKEKDVCDLGTRFDSLLRATEKTEVKVDDGVMVESGKIILNLDTNTTTTMKPEVCSTVIETLNTETSDLNVSAETEEPVIDRSKDETLKSLTYSSGNTFVPIGNRTDGLHSDLSNDLFASLQVPSSSHNPESISPTAAFLMAFPLVSSLNGKTEVLEEEMKEDLKYHSQTPPMLLQIGAIEPNSFKVKNDPPIISSDKTNSQERENSKIATKLMNEVPKALPKIVNSETIKERLYKVVQFPETTIASENFTLTSNSRPNDTIIENVNVINNVLTGDTNATISHGTEKCENSGRKCETQSSLICSKYEGTSRTIVPVSNCTSELPKYETTGRYPTIPDYVPGYTNFMNQPRTSYGTTKTTSSNSTISAHDGSSTISYPSMRSHAVQSAYVAHTTGKEPQVTTQQVYGHRSKDSIVSTSESMASYAPFPPVSQSLQHNYPARTKESYQSYDIHGKDPPVQNYPIPSGKNSVVHDSSSAQHDRSYVISRLNESIPSGIPSTKETQNVFQNYPTISQSKEPTEQRNNPETSGRLNSRERTEPVVTSGKIENFGQNGNYTSFLKEKQNLHVSDSMFQGKRNEIQTYVPYSRDSKKPIFDASSSSISHVSKTQIPNSSNPRYGAHNQQQQQTCVGTSNYSASNSTIPSNVDNTVKSTTTVAHNSSNFSILSWTTFSPISGSGNNNNNNNNNLVQYEAGADHVEEPESKTVCENYAFAPIHKEAYGNILPGEGFAPDVPIVDKPREKLVHDGLKPQNFDDPSKNKTGQAIVPEQKSSRPHNQNANSTEEYKFGSEKNKVKYPMGSAYTQTEFTGLDHQQASKSHQTTKTEKSNYTIPTYDSHASFDIAETNVPIKCNSEIYSSANYKYTEEKDPNAQLKYQPHVQTQASILHHNNSSYNNTKHGQQTQQPQSQQQQTKSKPVVQQQLQQQPVRPPVNWMMTPEIKHNTNISDLILPPIGKELEFCQNNIFTQPPSYNQSTPNQFYNNYDVGASGPHGFPNIATLQNDPRRIDGFYTEEQPFSWSPTKNSQTEHNQTIKSMDQHVVVPSTLPTLVGDLALGTNISEKQSFLFGQMPSRTNKDVVQTPVTKDKEVVGRDYQNMLNTQNVQQTVQGTSFLSVSQLVEHEKAEKSQQNHLHHHHHHHHHQQQQPAPQQTRKQRKNNASPRTPAKRQLETRKQSNVEQLHPQEEQKLAVHAFTDQSYHHQQPQQTQKYQQNDVHWRNRQCKSNYTAEALIGGNTSVHDANQEKQLQTSTIKSFASEYPQNKYPGGLTTTDMVMPPINYLANASDDPNSYGQVVNQNFNHSSYAYSPNTNIYPTTNFITSISNTPTSYMMPLHENPSDFLEPNSFLLPNVSANPKTSVNTSSTVSTTLSTRLASTTSVSVAGNPKNHQQHYASSVVKQQNCEKRNSYSNGSKKSKRKGDNNNSSMHNLEFPISSVGSPLEDYHSHPHHHHHHHHHTHPTSFLAPPHANPLYQNHSHPSSVGLATNSNRVARGGGASSNNPNHTHHHPSGTSLTNFNLSTIFPEINDKVTGYKPSNVIPPGLPQSSNHSTATYPQRGNYPTNNTLGHVPQESTQFSTDLPTAPPSGVLHYKTT